MTLVGLWLRDPLCNLLIVLVKHVIRTEWSISFWLLLATNH